MVNKVIILGRLGKDPELKYTQEGTPIANMSIATDESYTDRDGNKVDKTEWHRVVAFQRVAENCANFLAKGSLVFVEGSLQTRKWQNQQGQDQYTTEIKAHRVQFLDRKGSHQEKHEDQEVQEALPKNQSRPQNGTSQNNRQGSNQGNGNRNGNQGNRNQSAGYEQDYGSAFPSEASGMDDVPF